MNLNAVTVSSSKLDLAPSVGHRLNDQLQAGCALDLSFELMFRSDLFQTKWKVPTILVASLIGWAGGSNFFRENLVFSFFIGVVIAITMYFAIPGKPESG